MEGKGPGRAAKCLGRGDRCFHTSLHKRTLSRSPAKEAIAKEAFSTPVRPLGKGPRFVLGSFSRAKCAPSTPSRTGLGPAPKCILQSFLLWERRDSRPLSARVFPIDVAAELVAKKNPCSSSEARRQRSTL